MMKTRIAALLPAAVLIMSLGACSSDKPTSESTTSGEVTSTTAAPPEGTTTTVAGGGSSTTEAPSGSSELSKSVTDHLGAVHNQTDVTVTGDEAAGIKIVYGAAITAADAGSLCGNAAMVAGPDAAITVESADGTRAASRPASGNCA